MANLIYERKVVSTIFNVEKKEFDTVEETVLKIHSLPNDGEFNRYMVSFYANSVKTEEYIERLHFQADALQTNFFKDLIATAMRLKKPYIHKKNLLK